MEIPPLHITHFIEAQKQLEILKVKLENLKRKPEHQFRWESIKKSDDMIREMELNPEIGTLNLIDEWKYYLHQLCKYQFVNLDNWDYFTLRYTIQEEIYIKESRDRIIEIKTIEEYLQPPRLLFYPQAFTLNPENYVNQNYKSNI